MTFYSGILWQTIRHVVPELGRSERVDSVYSKYYLTGKGRERRVVLMTLVLDKELQRKFG